MKGVHLVVFLAPVALLSLAACDRPSGVAAPDGPHLTVPGRQAIPLKGAVVQSSGGLRIAIEVTQPSTRKPLSVNVSTDGITIDQDSSTQVTALAVHASGRTVPGFPITYSSSNTTVFTITSNGVVQAVAPGSATLTAASLGLSTSVPVQVNGHPPLTAALQTTTLTGRPFGVAVALNGAMFVTRVDSAKVARGNLPALTFPTSIAVGTNPLNVAVNGTGTTAYVANQTGNSVSVINVATNTVTTTVSLGTDSNAAFIAVGPDDKKVYVTLGNRSALKIIDAATNTVTKTITVGSVPNGIAFHRTQPLMYVSNAGGTTVTEINTQTETVTRTFNTNAIPQGLAFSRDTNELYVVTETVPTGFLEVWNTDTGTRIANVSLGARGFGLALSPDDRHLYVTEPANLQIQVWARATRTLLRTITGTGTVRRVAFDRFGATAVIAAEGNSVHFLR